MAEQPINGLNIRIVKFFSKQREEIVKEAKDVPFADGRGGLAMVSTMDYRKTGKMITEDWVEYAPPGQLDRATTRQSIAAIKAIKRSGAEHHPAADAQYAIKEYILKHYELWKQGEEMPVEGTPLAAWNALDTDMVASFKKAGIRTVEEIRDISDTIMSKIQIPRLRELKALAARFLEAADQNRAASELKRRDEEMEALKQQIADMQKHIASMPDKKTLSMPKTEAAA